MPSPVSYKIHPSKKFVIHTVLEGHTSEDLVASIHARVNDPDYQWGMDVIWNFGVGADPIELRHTFRILTMANNVLPLQQEYRIALVAADELVFASLRQFASLADSLPSQFKVFLDLELAKIWLMKARSDSSKP